MSSNLTLSAYESISIRGNQSATITGTGLEVAVIQYINGPCPPNAECFWSGQGLKLEYKLNGNVEKGLNLTQAFGYQITIVDSDYATYAALIIAKQ